MTVRKALKNGNISFPTSKQRGRIKTRNLFKPTGPDQLWETDITYLPTENGSQYVSHQLESATNLLGIMLEFTQKHTPKYNGNIESFYNPIKTDYIRPAESDHFHEPSIAIEKAFLDYNGCTPHSSIDYFLHRELRKRFEKKEVEVRQNEIQG